MKAKTKTNKKTSYKKLIILAVALLLVVAAAVFFLAQRHLPEDNPAGLSSQDTSEQSPIDDTVYTDNNPKAETAPIETETTNPPVTPFITYISENNGTISVSALLEAETVAGVCRLTLTKPGADTIVKESTIYKTTTYTCGFSIPVPSVGGWTATLVNTIGDKTSTPATQEVKP